MGRGCQEFVCEKYDLFWEGYYYIHFSCIRGDSDIGVSVLRKGVFVGGGVPDSKGEGGCCREERK